MKMEKVTCSWVSETPSCAVHGFVNSVHTYCGLEMAIMQISPRVSCIHLLPKNPVVRVDCAKAIFMFDHSLEWTFNPRGRMRYDELPGNSPLPPATMPRTQRLRPLGFRAGMIDVSEPPPVESIIGAAPPMT